jgi:hypothetical protein
MRLHAARWQDRQQLPAARCRIRLFQVEGRAPPAQPARALASLPRRELDDPSAYSPPEAKQRRSPWGRGRLTSANLFDWDDTVLDQLDRGRNLRRYERQASRHGRPSQ